MSTFKNVGYPFTTWQMEIKDYLLQDVLKAGLDIFILEKITVLREKKIGKEHLKLQEFCLLGFILCFGET